ncbi:MAB_1171c family putative transporter [Nocardia lijiangensis]|uniref:MAB_1171c family putative transporter n=1 Tax=Nocardia lijiangensis TaxID=299618 RepID=UPI000A94FB51|nr:MAB_1171c family putative transporter [Nocardia lijiangensis]
MSTLPLAVVVAVAVFLAAIVVGRWFLVNELLIDRLINAALSWDLAAIVAYEIASVLGMRDLAEQLFLGLGALSLAYGYGFARLLDGMDSVTLRSRQRRYNRVGAVTGAVILSGPALSDLLGSPADQNRVIWTVGSLVIASCGALIARACVRELRTPDPTTGERWAYSALLVFGLYCCFASGVGAFRIFAGMPSAEPGLPWAVATFVMLVLVAALIAIPLFSAVLVRSGFDRKGRACRQLRPLWRDLTAAVPEIVLLQDDSHRDEPRSRLYRMTVEIQDALMHLRPYEPELSVEPGMEDYARRIAYAARAKASGEPPRPRGAIPAGAGQALGDDDRAAGLRDLLRLAKAWPKEGAGVRD